MSEEVKTEVTTEEQPAATEQPAAEQPAAEQPAAEEPPKTDDQPAVTEVTEVTEQPAATEGEGEAKKEEGEKKEEEKPKEEKKETKPKAVKPPVDYRTVKQGWVEKPGVIFKSFKRYFMSLDEEGSVLRWWKNEERTSSDGALYMKFCAKVTEPTEEFTTNWPEGTDDRRFVISSPHRAFYLVAETADERNDWIAKLNEAMNKYKGEDVKVITTNPMSIESLKASISSASADAETTLEKEGVATKKTEETPKTDEAAAAPAAATTEEPKPEEEAKPETEVKVEVTVETTATEEPPKTEEATEKKEEEKPAEGEGGEEPKTE